MKGRRGKERRKRTRSSASWRFARAMVINVRSSVIALKDAPLRGSVIRRGVNHGRISARSFSFCRLCVWANERLPGRNDSVPFLSFLSMTAKSSSTSSSSSSFFPRFGSVSSSLSLSHTISLSLCLSFVPFFHTFLLNPTSKLTSRSFFLSLTPNFTTYRAIFMLYLSGSVFT